MKKFLYISFHICLGVLLLLAVCDTIVESTSNGVVFNNIEDVPVKQTALVLGTSYKTRNGYINPYFQHRMEAAAALYKSGRVRYIIVSGDNGRKTYDESSDMKAVLMSLGVPENVIFLDYAGFRTLDSVVRCKAIFNQDDVVIVSQEFHNQRAVFLSQVKGINAVGYNAKDIHMKYGFAVHVREKLARVKAVLDIVMGKEPKFYGPKVDIEHA